MPSVSRDSKPRDVLLASPAAGAVSAPRASAPAPKPAAPNTTDHELWAAAALALPDALCIKDTERRYVSANPAFLTLFGLDSFAALEGKLDEEVFGAALAQRCIESDEELLRSGVGVAYDDTRTFPDGSEHVLAVGKEPIHRDGVLWHIVVRLRDVTRERETEQRLLEATAELEQRVEDRTRTLRATQQSLLRKERMAVLGQLAGGIAHQIRNPLAAINNAGAVLRRKVAGVIDDSDVDQSLEVIREEVWEANRIIGELLEYTRIRPASPRDVRVDDIVEHALSMVRLPDQITLEFESDGTLLARVDEQQMCDAVAHVVRNAIEAMGAGGRLIISASADDDDWLRIAVQDTGPGLTRASVNYLFEPLVTSKPLGLGLGLAMARALVENQNGKIRLATNAGGGARFEMHLPRVIPA